jgi:hypothetical protein
MTSEKSGLELSETGNRNRLTASKMALTRVRVLPVGWA